MIASGLLNVRCCCTSKLEDYNHVGIIPICDSAEGRKKKEKKKLRR